MKSFKRLLILFISLFILCGCELFGEESNSNPQTKIISSKEPNISLYVGEMYDLPYKMNFKLEDGEELVFESSNESVATVDPQGFMYAVGKGVCEITVSYSEDVYTLFFIEVKFDCEFVSPTKKEYHLGDPIDLTGGIIKPFYSDGTPMAEVSLTSSMISGFDSSKAGDQTVKVTYQNMEFSYIVKVLNDGDYQYMVSSITIPETIKTNEKLEMKVVHSSLNELKNSLSSLYDYYEYKIKMTIKTPSNKTETIYAFYMQDYTEKKTNTFLDSSSHTEGTVNSADGYNYSILWKTDGQPYYCFRYNPDEVGTYSYTISVIRNENATIQTLTGSFEASKGEESHGNIKVNASKYGYEFEDGTTYMAVGQNVAWYTSTQRKLGDYRLWFTKMAANDCNFARVWLSAWGYSLFWDNVKNYTSRLDEAYDLDNLVEMAEELGIYLDLSFFQHGMFSESVNPLWPNSNNTWYTSRYGANPYSKILSTPGEFFTSQEAKKWCKNYITYIVSRYGYSESIMSYELFNEVDWVESYTKDIGNSWHDEMAKYIKAIDNNNHLVTTSIKGDDTSGYTTGVASVFSLSSIDYVSVHCYGVKNYANYIPSKVKTMLARFGKPVMYQEVGYGGNSGSDQISKDPNDVSLHQELWGGLMCSCSSGMNWWWDSWIEPANSYSKFKGPGKAAKMMNLSGMSLIYGSSDTSSQSNTMITGYKSSNKAYVYLTHKEYDCTNTSKSLSTTITLNGFETGKYTLTFYDTYTMEVISSKTVTIVTSKLSFSATGTNDLFITITK